MRPIPALTIDEIKALEHDFIGPSWQKDESGGWLLPEFTLGWQILGWCSRYLLDLGNTGGPLNLTDEQARIILWWYAVDENGEFVYRRGILQRVKGWGKDPFTAVICAIEFIGPCRFGGWGVDSLGNKTPIAVPHPRPWVQVAGVSRDATKNTADVFPGLFSREAIEEYGIKLGAEITRARSGKSRLEVVTSSPRTLEGNRPTFATIGEPHHMVRSNQGLELYAVIRRNLTKTGSRLMAITNAYQPGEDSVAERMRESYDKIRAGLIVDPGYFYDSIEAHPATPLTPEALEVVLPIVRGDSVWLKPADIMADVMDPMVSPEESRRFYLNQIVADAESLHGRETWDVLKDGYQDETFNPGDEIVLGFDGGKSDDATALIGIRISDGFVQRLLLEEQPPTDMRAVDADGKPIKWEVNRAKVDSAVRDAFRTYNVKGFYADVALWESYIADWAHDYEPQLRVRAPGRDGISWDMRSSLQRSTMAHERLMAAIFDGKLHHDGDPALRAHVLNARRRVNRYGVSFGKESPESPRKVDAYAAMMLAHEALTDYRTSLTARKPEKRARTGRSWIL